MRGLVLASARVENGLTSSDAGRLAAHRALSLLLGRSSVAIDNWDICRDRNGKPVFCVPGASVVIPALAITHAGDLAIAAVSQGARVGLDLEWRRPRAPSARRRLAALSNEEAVLESTSFEVLWTIHEAMFKATEQVFVSSQPRVVGVMAECPSALCGWWAATLFTDPLTFVNPLWVMSVVALPYRALCAVGEWAASDPLFGESHAQSWKHAPPDWRLQAAMPSSRSAEVDTTSQRARRAGLVVNEP